MAYPFIRVHLFTKILYHLQLLVLVPVLVLEHLRYLLGVADDVDTFGSRGMIDGSAVRGYDLVRSNHLLIAERRVISIFAVGVNKVQSHAVLLMIEIVSEF